MQKHMRVEGDCKVCVPFAHKLRYHDSVLSLREETFV